MEGEDVELRGSVLDQLLDAVVTAGRDFNAVLVWNYTRLSRNAARLVEIKRTFSEHGLEQALASESLLLAASERQLD